MLIFSRLLFHYYSFSFWKRPWHHGDIPGHGPNNLGLRLGNASRFLKLLNRGLQAPQWIECIEPAQVGGRQIWRCGSSAPTIV